MCSALEVGPGGGSVVTIIYYGTLAAISTRLAVPKFTRAPKSMQAPKVDNPKPNSTLTPKSRARVNDTPPTA